MRVGYNTSMWLSTCMYKLAIHIICKEYLFCLVYVTSHRIQHSIDLHSEINMFHGLNISPCRSASRGAALPAPVDRLHTRRRGARGGRLPAAASVPHRLRPTLPLQAPLAARRYNRVHVYSMQMCLKSTRIKIVHGAFRG